MVKQKLWKGLVAGGAAGLAASLAMNRFQNLWSKASKKLGHGGQQESSSRSGEENEDATMKVVAKVAEIGGYHLSREPEKKAGPIVHYAFDTGGALYGTIMELGPRKLQRQELLSGVGFGSMLFAGADEIAVPAAGLSGPPREYPLSSHVCALVSHLVHGLTTGALRKLVRAVW